MSHMIITKPLSGMVCRRLAGTSHDQAVYQILFAVSNIFQHLV